MALPRGKWPLSLACSKWHLIVVGWEACEEDSFMLSRDCGQTPDRFPSTQDPLLVEPVSSISLTSIICSCVACVLAWHSLCPSVVTPHLCARSSEVTIEALTHSCHLPVSITSSMHRSQAQSSPIQLIHVKTHRRLFERVRVSPGRRIRLRSQTVW